LSGSKNDRVACSICGQTFPRRQLVSNAVVRAPVADTIRRQHPEWPEAGFICVSDLTRYRGQYVHSLLASERGELSTLEQEVLVSLREHELLAENVDLQFEREWSLGERLADRIADVGGSWRFLIGFGAFLAIWITGNTLALLARPFDPYPYILLNLVLSCLAAIQAPVIMMSQNRQEAKDRMRSQHDYQINLKAELEIQHLHEKIDHLLSKQWERLVEIQEVQLDLLAEIGRKR